MGWWSGAAKRLKKAITPPQAAQRGFKQLTGQQPGGFSAMNFSDILEGVSQIGGGFGQSLTSMVDPTGVANTYMASLLEDPTAGLGGAFEQTFSPGEVGKRRRSAAGAFGMDDPSSMQWLYGPGSMFGESGTTYNPTTGQFGEAGSSQFTDAYDPNYAVAGAGLTKIGQYQGGQGQKAYGGFDPQAFTNVEDAISAVFGGAGLTDEQLEELRNAIKNMTVSDRAVTMGAEGGEEYKSGRENILRDILAGGGYRQAQTGGGGGYTGTTPSLGTQKATEEMQRYLQPYEQMVGASTEAAQGDITDIINTMRAFGEQEDIDMPDMPYTG